MHSGRDIDSRLLSRDNRRAMSHVCHGISLGILKGLWNHVCFRKITIDILGGLRIHICCHETMMDIQRGPWRPCFLSRDD